MDYEEYQDVEVYENPRKKLLKKIIIILLILVAILGIIFLIRLAVRSRKVNEPTPTYTYSTWFEENINKMKEAAISYYTLEKLPSEEGGNVRLTLKQMVEFTLLSLLNDAKGNACRFDDSYVEVIKLSTEYQMKVSLNCGGEKDYLLVYLAHYDYCKYYLCENKETESTTEETTKSSSSSSSSSSRSTSSSTSTSTSTTTKKKRKVTSESDTSSNSSSISVISKSYKYLYTKEVAAQYSAWSNWSEDKEYTSSSNITWGKKEFVWNEKNGSKTTTTTKEVKDTLKPIFQTTYDNVIGSYTQYVCSEFKYFRDSSTSTTYRYGDWKSQGTKVFEKVPTDTTNTRYLYKGMDYTMCSDSCTLKPYYIYEVQTRKITAENRSQSQLSAVCNVEKKQIDIYGEKQIIVGYLTNRVTSTTTKYYYHTKTRTLISKAYTSSVWSNSSNDKDLIAQGYKYTGRQEEI